MTKNIRIRTTPNGDDSFIKLQLKQDFDFLEILSLKISQEDVYRNFYADYGVVVGRISLNNGLGVPNAKVSIFIPLTDEDAENLEISALYPYSDIAVTNSDGIRYNTLPRDSQGECHTPVGSFPSKMDLVDNDKLNDIYDKYYKFTTTTNGSGDFMIFGVPVGGHILNVDVDLSDIGVYSQRPYDFIEQGNPPNLFESSNKFNSGNNLNNLTQINSRQVGINIIPFWGDEALNEIGITRLDVDLNYNIKPKAIFMGSLFGDNEKNSVNKNCRAKKKLGKVCEMSEGGGTIQMLRKNIDGYNERFDIKGGRVINDHGAWAYQIPMNLDYMVTDEYGKLIQSEDTEKGIPTRARLRFKISTDATGDEGRIRTKGKYLVPNNPQNVGSTDYSFDETTPNESFRDFYWNKVYTVKNFIGRFQKNDSEENRNFIGFKDVDDCVGTKNPLPFRTVDTDYNPIFIILCRIIGFVVDIVNILNKVVSRRVLCGIVGGNCIALNYEGTLYTPGCTGNGSCGNRHNINKEVLKGYYAIMLARALNVFEFDFYNDWINGSLYAFLLKYKKNNGSFMNDYSEKFCGAEEGNGNDNNYLGNSNHEGLATKGEFFEVDEGVIDKFGDELFYKPMSLGNHLMYATDIYNLGSVFDCDWQGISKTHIDLLPTSYSIPPDTADEGSEYDESTIVPFLLGINCDGVKVNEQQSARIRSVCEIGIGLDENTDGLLTAEDVTNELLRRKLIKLNNVNYKDVLIDDIDDTFIDGDDYKVYRTFYNFNTDENPFNQPLGDSFFFYFGTKPNNTAIELMNSKYFTTCDKLTENVIKIQGEITDDTLLSTDPDEGNGIIEIFVTGGSGEYTFLWSKDSIPFSTAQNIVGLTEGMYKVVVTDENESIGIAIFNVRGLHHVDFFPVVIHVVNQESTDGVILINSITGGVGPYEVIINKTNGSELIFNDVVYALRVENLSEGEYVITVKDTSDPSLVKVKTVNINVADTLSITYPIITHVTCFGNEDGSISFIPHGGIPPYTIELSIENGYVYDNENNVNLPVGNYTLMLSDSAGQSVSQTNMIIEEGVDLELIKNSGSNLTLTGAIIGVEYVLYDDDDNVEETITATATQVIFEYPLTNGDYFAEGENCSTNYITIDEY